MTKRPKSRLGKSSNNIHTDPSNSLSRNASNSQGYYDGEVDGDSIYYEEYEDGQDDGSGSAENGTTAADRIVKLKLELTDEFMKALVGANDEDDRGQYVGDQDRVDNGEGVRARPTEEGEFSAGFQFSEEEDPLVTKRPAAPKRPKGKPVSIPKAAPAPKSKASASSSSSTTGAGASAKPPNSTSSAKSAKGKGKEQERKPSPKVEVLDEYFEGEEVVQKRSLRGRAGKKVEVVEEEFFEDDDGGDGGETRCVCREDTDEMSSGLMIQCDTCKCWQHGPCVGLWGEKDCPDRYFCELCRPGWHGPGGLLRKTHRKVVPTTASGSHQRSPPIPSGSLSRNKARESADAALVSTFLAADSAVTLATPGVARSEREKSEKNLGGGGKEPTSPKSPSMPSGVGASGLTADGKAPKKRSTMNSRDAAYDDAIAMSILGPGSAAMRARLEKATGGEEESLSDHESDDGVERRKRSPSRESVREAPKVEEEQPEEPPSKKRRVSSPPVPPAIVVEEPPTRASSPLVPMEVTEEVEAVVEKLLEVQTEVRGEDDEEMLEQHPHSNEDGDDGSGNHPTRAKHPNQYTYRPKNGPTPTKAPRASPVKRGAPAVVNPVEHALRPQKPREWTPLEAAGWGLPDHLKHLTFLLPTANPIPIPIPVHSRLPTSDNGSSSNHTSSSNSFMNGSKAQTTTTTLEAPTRVRFPTKRMTMPEMKKRSRNVLDYLARIQIELAEREKRSDGSGAGVVVVVPLPAREEEEVDERDSMALMDELTKDVLLFQQKFFGSME